MEQLYPNYVDKRSRSLRTLLLEICPSLVAMKVARRTRVNPVLVHATAETGICCVQRDVSLAVAPLQKAERGTSALWIKACSSASKEWDTWRGGEGML